ncbi:MAG: hypothetical protein AAF191_11510 [Verrucomicrobiota bacterium]
MTYSNTDTRLPTKVRFSKEELERILDQIFDDEETEQAASPSAREETARTVSPQELARS